MATAVFTGGLLGQLAGDIGIPRPVEVVTIDIGGNDLFEPVLAACAGVPAPGEPDCATVVSTVFGTFWVNFNSILSQLRAAAGPDTTIIVMTYYNSLLAPCPFSGVAFLGDLVLGGGGPVPAGGFNGLIRGIAALHDADVADTFGDLAAEDLVGDCLHPDDSGHAIIADEFLGAFNS